MKFEIGSQWKTRGGHRAMVLARCDDDSMLVWHEDESAGDICGHEPDGSISPSESPCDLIEPWVEPKTYSGWVNVYRAMCQPVIFSTLYKDRDSADKVDTTRRIACIKVEFQEGEGL